MRLSGRGRIGGSRAMPMWGGRVAYRYPVGQRGRIEAQEQGVVAQVRGDLVDVCRLHRFWRRAVRCGCCPVLPDPLLFIVLEVLPPTPQLNDEASGAVRWRP